MSNPISSIRNLGPATEVQFAKAGITTAEQLYALGADAAYRRLLQADLPPHFIGYYVLVMALQGRPWNDCKGDEKKALRVKFDALKAEVAAQARKAPAVPGKIPRDLEQALNLLGVRAAR
jgi:DNA transformation protein and related proteins